MVLLGQFWKLKNYCFKNRSFLGNESSAREESCKCWWDTPGHDFLFLLYILIGHMWAAQFIPFFHTPTLKYLEIYSSKPIGIGLPRFVCNLEFESDHYNFKRGKNKLSIVIPIPSPVNSASPKAVNVLLMREVAHLVNSPRVAIRDWSSFDAEMWRKNLLIHSMTHLQQVNDWGIAPPYTLRFSSNFLICSKALSFLGIQNQFVGLLFFH